ncbi:hypothetical protein VTL71DRAFT_4803 [Oculimacula yallundae]|uniref:FAD-binding domain-containing protein n=1 Tax=Oculimacula yallundae TaxID=86028 RepID=A0ABR4C4R6_9HELO
MTSPIKEFRVLVVGGGITGLALACALERAGIEYVVLESRDEVAPQVGASIAILPNGMRLLDQLGITEKVLPGAVMYDSNTLWIGGNGDEMGRKPIPARMHMTAKGEITFGKSRHGYGVFFLERQKLQQELYNAIADKSKFLTGRKVKSVDHSEKEVVVKCENGEVYRGDVLLGADGTHSFVRGEMRKLIDEKDATLLIKDKKNSFVEYSCLYGISSATPGIEKADLHRAYSRDLACLTIGGIDDTYWFLYKRLDKKYFAPDIPRFTQADADAQAAEHMDFVIGGTDGKVTFGDMWKRKKVGGLQSMDEGHNEHWTFGRIACVGDAVHKVTANSGLGGNMCLEGAAAVTNSLYKLLHSQKNTSTYRNGTAKLQNGDTKESKFTKPRPDLKAVEETLKAYHDGCKDRIEKAVKGANDYTRIETFRTFKDEMFAKYVAPAMGSLLNDLFSDGLVGGPKFDFLPVPKQSLGVGMPWNPKYGATKHEAMWKRALYALPLLGVFWVARNVLVFELPNKLGPVVMKSFADGAISDGASSVSLRTVYTGKEAVDSFMLPFIAGFTPSLAGLGGSGPAVKNYGGGVLDVYAPQRMQVMSFLTDFLALIAIWMIESCRRGTIFTFARISVLFLILAQLYGVGVIAPIYFFLHYVQIPSTGFHAADNRHVPMHFVKTIVPTLLLGYVVPTVAMFNPTASISTLQAWNFIWQPFPVYLAILHVIFSRLLPNTERMDRTFNVKGDLPWLRTIYFTTALTSAVMWIYTLFVSPTPLSQVFLSGLLDRDTTFKTNEEGMRMFLKYDEVFCFTSAAIWVLLCFSDLKREGRLTASWGKVLAVYAGLSLGLGPGTGLVSMWWWREEILARPGLEG